MDSSQGIFEFHLSALPHHVLIPTLDKRLEDALKSLISGKLIPEKYPYYLLYGMMKGFGIVHNRVPIGSSGSASRRGTPGGGVISSPRSTTSRE